MAETRPDDSTVTYSEQGAFATSDWGRTVVGASLGTVFVTDEELVCGHASRVSTARMVLDKLLFRLPSALGLVHATSVDLEDALAHDETVRVPLVDVTSIELESWALGGRKLIVDAADHLETPVYITAGGSVRETGHQAKTEALAEEIRAAAADAGNRIGVAEPA